MRSYLLYLDRRYLQDLVLLIDLVTLSARLPHVSGFYKLIRLLVVLCERCSFFGAKHPDYRGASLSNRSIILNNLLPLRMDLVNLCLWMKLI